MSIPVDRLRSCMLTPAEECWTHSGLGPGRLVMVPSHKALIAHSFALLHIGDLRRFRLAEALSAFHYGLFRAAFRAVPLDSSCCAWRQIIYTLIMQGFALTPLCTLAR